MARTVIAAKFGDIPDLELVDLPDADPGPGQVVVDVRAASLNPADLKQLRGQFGGGSFPLRFGSEVSGVVAAVGDTAEGEDADGPVGPPGPIAVGDEVVVYPARGGFTERLVAKATSVLPKPTALDWGAAAGVLVGATTAFHLVEATRVTAGDRVLVWAALGNVGLDVVQLARLRGAEVVGVVRAGREAELEAFGAVGVASGPGLDARLRAALPGGADVALDTLGSDESLDAAVAFVADRSRIATIAAFARGAELGIQLLGGGPGADPGSALRSGARAELLTLAGDGLLVGPPVIPFALDRVREAMSLLDSGRAGGKVVLIP